MAGDDKLRERIRGIRSEIGQRARRLLGDAIDLAKMIWLWLDYQLIIAPYFRYWSYKTQILRWFKYGALTIVSSSTGILAFEIVLEVLGPERLAEWLNGAHISAMLNWFSQWRPTGLLILPESAARTRLILFALLIISAVYLTLHNVEEARKPGHEYQFARAINSLLLNCRIARASGTTVPIAEALNFLRYVFRYSGIKHVALHLPDDQGTLTIKREHVVPPEADFTELTLQRGQGVAGRVYDDPDAHVQYMPRMFLPVNRRYGGWLFPHSVRFLFSRPAPAGHSGEPPLWEVGNEEINPDLFVPAPNSRINYQSLLSVPAVSVIDQQLLGVVTLVFSRTAALDKAGIAMALTFVLLLTGEIRSGNIKL